jgi:hypothetical protein
MTIKRSGDRRGKSQLMPRDMVCVCVRYKTPRLAPADINAKLSGGQKESGVVMKHAMNHPWGHCGKEDDGSAIEV